MILTGTNKDFSAVWNCDTQTYSVYKGPKWIIDVYSFRLVKNYIN